ncbi:MAG: hypothetical protein AAB263_09130 [Planctomycetota bacterium]
MPRSIVVVAAWMVATVLVVVVIGQRFQSHRMADPVRVLGAWLPWVPDDFRQCAEVRANRRDGDQLFVQVEIRAEPELIRRFAKRNGFVDGDVNHGKMAVESWTLGDRAPAGLVVQMLMPAGSNAALLTVLGQPPPPR